MCAIAIDEAHRTLFEGDRIKNLDFILFTRSGGRLLVDVKGRRFPGGAQKQYFQISKIASRRTKCKRSALSI